MENSNLTLVPYDLDSISPVNITIRTQPRPTSISEDFGRSDKELVRAVLGVWIWAALLLRETW